ncbi:MAG: hypothetical protein WCL18_05725 [bacterium]
MLEIDSLATENVFLRENQIEYSIHNKKSEFSFEEVRNKYINAKKERITIQAREKNLQDKLDDCDTYLPIIANSIIPDNAENKSFREHPDDPKEHQPMWHEFGIITHSKKMLQQFFNRNNWLKPIKKQIDSVLQETIDGKTKEELMAISIIFHNIGKYLRTIYIKNGEREIAHPDHEQLGKNICMTNPHVQKLIQDRYHLTEKQYNYMTNCIGLHFELAKLRVNSQTIQQGYNLQYTHSDKFMRICENIRNKNPEYKTEIGVLFLCDSLAKTDITVYEKSDEKLLEKKKTMIQLLEEKKMPAELINPVMQKPINIAVAKKYLEYLYATEDDKKN